MHIDDILERWARWRKPEDEGLYWPSKTFIGALMSLMPSSKCKICRGRGKVYGVKCDNCKGSGKIKFKSSANKINPAFIRGTDGRQFTRDSADELSWRVDRIIASRLVETQQAVVFAEFVFTWKYHHALKRLNLSSQDYKSALNTAKSIIAEELKAFGSHYSYT